MNETKKAIEHFHYGITHDIFSEPVTTYARLAVDALREQAEREKGCFWCLDVSLNDVRINEVRVNINCCPMCGRRLEVEQDA